MVRRIPKVILLIFSVAILLFIISSILLFNRYQSLNNNITTHLDFSGTPDKTGSKIHLIYGLLVNLGILFIAFFLINYPKYANYPVEINNENRNSAYLKMRYFLGVISIVTSMAFLWMILIQSY